MQRSTAEAAAPDPRAARPAAPGLALAALGIVYGDLGTSPLYTFQTIVGDVGGHPSAADALGLLSLVIWALILIVSFKYCGLVMRADNHGEGGILALMSLVTSGRAGRTTAALITAGLFGAALLYGDGIITPAISVLSALEGVNVATPALKPYVLPTALVILVALFAAQRFGTARIGRVFGPVMLLWFAVIGLIGLGGVVRHPAVLSALDPSRAVGFLLHHGMASFTVLGGVFLAVTGGEALYADMGHIGRAPIRLAWFVLVLPALLLSYAGQTALLLAHPDAQGNPFFLLCPSALLIPLVVLATLATVIASQAIITGAFSLTRQAMQLGWFPGLNIRQTSSDEYGQIYVPVVNWAMMLLTLVLTFGFGSSDRLAGAYGTAVSTTMLLTTALLFDAMRAVWRWPLVPALLVSLAFLGIDLVFFSANLLKLLDGGWIPLLLGIVLFTVMTTWRRGIAAVRTQLAKLEEAPDHFLRRLDEESIPRVPGTAVFLSRQESLIPPVLARHVSEFKAVQETIIGVTVRFEEIPRIAAAERAEVRKVARGLWHATVRFGFMEVPDLIGALVAVREKGCPLDLSDALYIAGRDEVVRSTRRERMASWRRMLFGVMFRNAVRPTDRFALPADRFVEIVRQVAL
ncbi:MAG: KUP/HAK/KT family potassium transporter [Gluconacetobacter diazotrophicus]|nr:KUP/HAK/KT family potassium transporter [Gluconacetobacter diazotrophicus]